ncbi:MAG: TRL domain-containing protein [bacterium]|nr:TRL domain-containing protein [bacterium]
MNKFYLALLASALLLSGCAATSAPVSGIVFTNVKSAQLVGNAEVSGRALRTGEAKCKSILGMFATGDCSLEAAKKDGNITEVVTVDAESFSVLGFYAGYNLVVKGY